GMPVRTQLGLVGRVLEVADTTSRVLLITDPESIVPVQRARDGVPAFAQGRGDGSLLIRLISLGINPLRPGDVLVTSGSGGLYAPGTAVAVVMQLTRDGAIARVLADPASIDYAAIYPVYAQAAQMTAALAPAPPPPVAAPKSKPKNKAKARPGDKTGSAAPPAPAIQPRPGGTR
ncbi:MAG TPA: rod shape-determining protein MreC, partial [Novosphingobium sp.]